MNTTLEQIATALFKSWFVDFDPWDGVMPNGWRNGLFNEIITATLNGEWGKDTMSGDNIQAVYCIRGADIPHVNAGNKGKMPIRYVQPKRYITKQLTAGDIVVEISGGSPTQSTGRCALITQSLLDRYDKDMICTNFCKAIKPFTNYSTFVYFYLKYLYKKNVMFAYENGTTGIKNLDFAGFLETESIIIPPIEITVQFTKIVEVFINKIFSNGLENDRLATVRDELLPKLMNGKIEVYI
jgi:type I restriction enzyme S subunit